MSKFRPLFIEKIEDGDVPAIIRIADECRLSPWSENDYREEAKRNDSIMLRLANETREIIGFIVGRHVAGSQIDGANDAELYNIGVTKIFRGAGWGTLLLQSFLAQCKNDSVHNVWLDVRASNTHAIEFYKKRGFVEFAERKRFYTNPVEHSIVMRFTCSTQ